MTEILSPGVFTEESDNSLIIGGNSGSIGVFAGIFTQGETNEATLVTSTAELINNFGEPTNDNYNDWYQCFNFLQYGNKLYVSRVSDVSGGTTETTPFLIGTDHTIEAEPISPQIGSNIITPGTGNDIAAALSEAYEVFENKNDIEVDIIIANESYPVGAINLAETRQDCIAFVGANLETTVGKRPNVAAQNIIDLRKNGDLNVNSMYSVLSGNYKYQYDAYNDTYRWVNIAGDIAGLRAQTNHQRSAWTASAGLEHGQIKNVKKLAFNPKESIRDLLYINGINPVCSFSGQGTVLWGQKTLVSKTSSFDRVNVRNVFNMIERNLEKTARNIVMDFNDNFTRNRMLAIINPYLDSIKGGRGIDDFYIICDISNNTDGVIAQNQLVIDIFIKPNYVAEFIQLRFTNAGSNSFSSIVVG